MTPTELKEYTLKDLAQMAKKRGIVGWHAMRKDELIRAIVRDAKRRPAANGRASANGQMKPARPTTATKRTPSEKIVRTLRNGRGAESKTSDRELDRTAVSSRGLARMPGKETVVPRTTAPANGTHDPSRATSARHPDATLPKSARIDRPVRNRVPEPAKAKTKVLRPVLSAVAREIQKERQVQERRKDLSGATARAQAPTSPPAVVRPPVSRPAPELPRDAESRPAANGASLDLRDRVVLMVRDPYWLHVHWELSSRSIQRAQAAMAEYWHTARPVLRLLEVPLKGTTSSTEMFVRDIEIHGGVNNWYIDVIDPPKGYRVEIGYIGSNGRFHSIARSNSVMTPEPGMCDALDQNWIDVAANCERIFALSGGYSAESSAEELQEVMEERLQRPVGATAMTRFGVGADRRNGRDRSFHFDVDAEMVIYGSTNPDAQVTMAGEPIKLREDGGFTLRMSLPDRRQVFPMTCCSRDGITQQTIVLAIERNTKIMEPLVRDANQ